MSLKHIACEHRLYHFHCVLSLSGKHGNSQTQWIAICCSYCEYMYMHVTKVLSGLLMNQVQNPVYETAVAQSIASKSPHRTVSRNQMPRALHLKLHWWRVSASSGACIRRDGARCQYHMCAFVLGAVFVPAYALYRCGIRIYWVSDCMCGSPCLPLLQALVPVMKFELSNGIRINID